MEGFLAQPDLQVRLVNEHVSLFQADGQFLRNVTHFLCWILTIPECVDIYLKMNHPHLLREALMGSRSLHCTLILIEDGEVQKECRECYKKIRG